MPKSANRFPRLPRIHAAAPQESEQTWQNAPQLLAALNGARLGAWLWDIDSGRISWSRATQALFGFEPDRPLPNDIDYLDLLPEFDQVLVMTVEPGFGGQSFMPETMPKLRALREAVEARGLETWLQVDGGVTEETIVTAAENGADTFVAGSSVFRGDPAAQIALLRETAAAHVH